MFVAEPDGLSSSQFAEKGWQHVAWRLTHGPLDLVRRIRNWRAIKLPNSRKVPLTPKALTGHVQLIVVVSKKFKPESIFLERKDWHRCEGAQEAIQKGSWPGTVESNRTWTIVRSISRGYFPSEN